MYFRILLIVLITLVVLSFFIYFLRLSRKYNSDGEGERKKSELENKIEEAERKREEEKRARIEDPDNLSSESLILRPVKLLDKKPLALILNDKRVIEPLGFERIKRVSRMEQLIKEEYMDVLGVYTIELLSTKRIIGLAKLEDGLNDESRHIEFVIGHQFWRHGFGKEALEALINSAKEQGATRVETELKEQDENTIAFLEATGFESEDSLTYFRKI